MATNRFVCEVCNKGFQRDQNLQLHRRGHNLPWKLKQRTSNEVLKKKVYVCPEAGCVHHDPSRALGDLTGIKKHFCRKHGEKKWKCDKCSKRYAVQSDWKAHSKTCGTREYRCDCGTLFSRRDSFITHRAFCDALAEESARAGTGLNPHQQVTGSTVSHLQQVQIPQFMINASHNHSLIDLQNPFSIRKEQQTFPPWLSYPPAALVGLGPGPGASQGPPPPPIDLTPSSSSSASQSQPLIFNTRVRGVLDQDDQAFPHEENPNSGLGPTLPPYHPTTASAHMSATALLQKAAQMGAAAISCKATAAPCSTSTSISQCSSMMTMISRPHHQAHVSANSVNNNTTTTGFGLNLLSSRDHPQEMTLSSFGNNKEGPMNPPPSFFHHQDHMLMNSYDGSTTYEDALVNGFLDAKKEDHGGTSSDHDHDLNLHHQLMLSNTSTVSSGTNNEEISGNGGNMGGRGGVNDGMTRDFLGLRALSHSDILNMAGLGDCINPNSNSPKSWQCDH